MSKRNVTFTQDEPAFIKKFKEKVGYKEGPTTDTKRQELQFDSDDDCEEQDDEKPVVVTLKKGDLTAEEAEAIQKKIDSQKKDTEDSDEPPADGKIIFHKPVKRSSDHESDMHATTIKKQKEEKKNTLETSETKKVKDSKLLSFNEDDDDEDNTDDDET
ncbi:hypothetical protein ACJMK2_010142 [Sinanodonta woodiana]|uniref:DUF4604 domain-containing protein n=1 Tax=Sinanodonta woodiana TaxID=1069815 RepID=A0ABD3VEE8_SINWO